MVVDEFGSVVGVLALEDIIENILGKEIFEHDDPAVDMRELANKNIILNHRKIETFSFEYIFCKLLDSRS